MAINGLEGVVPPNSINENNFDLYSFFVLENINLNAISAICKQNFKIKDSNYIIEEFHSRKKSPLFLLL